jgi:hypothetical protein
VAASPPRGAPWWRRWCFAAALWQLRRPGRWLRTSPSRSTWRPTRSRPPRRARSAPTSVCAARWGGASQSPALRAALRLAALPRPGGQYRCLAVGAAAGGGGAVRGAWGSQPPSLCCLLFALTCWLCAQATRASLTSPGSCTSSAWASTVRPAPTRASARGGEARLFGISARPPNAACPLRRPLCPPARALRRGCTMALAPPSRQAAPARARATLAPTVPWQSQSLGG